MHIICLTLRTWKVINGEVWSMIQLQYLCCGVFLLLSSTYPVHGSGNGMNHSGTVTQVVSCHCFISLYKLTFVVYYDAVLFSAYPVHRPSDQRARAHQEGHMPEGS